MRRQFALFVSMAAALIGLGMLVLLYRSETPAAGAQMTEAQTPLARAPSQDHQEETFLGVILARESVDVVAQLNGRDEGMRVEDMRVRLGDHVSKGTTLAVLDTRRLRDELAIAEATLRAARADETQAALSSAEARERHARRQRLVRNRPVISEEELASARYQEQYTSPRLEAARARVAEQQARVEQLRHTLAEGEIRAPFDGFIAVCYVNPGATVTRGTPVVRLISASDPWVRFAVPTDEATALKPGLPITVSVEGEDSTVPGVIEKVAPEVDAASRMIITEARVSLPDNMNGRALAGRVAYVKAPSSTNTVASQREDGPMNILRTGR